ncbi:unnamed protein product [Polarella glacialis]|uniref:WW domain-containing protein n=1 Tax=Polarella glacialis TaxID=89957 RepID=A0A813IZX9_POLGL|nr:unnamed protein product [Polarella glacialis]
MLRLVAQRLLPHPIQPRPHAVRCFAAARGRATKKASPPAAVKDQWSEVSDPSTGQSYWWNQQTNETTAVGAAKPGPDFWEAVQDPSSGGTYWWNKESNETTAVGAPKPSAVAGGQQAGVPAQAAPAGGLMGGGMGGGLGASMASGMAMGVGMSVASRMVDGVMGPRQTEVVHRDEGGGESQDGGGGNDGGGGSGWGDSGGGDGGGFDF